MKFLLVRLITLSIILFLVGCFERAVAPEELTGTWSVTQESLQRMPVELRRSSPILILNADKTFDGRDVPGSMWGQGQRVISGRGNWRLNEGNQTLTLSLLTVAEGDQNRVPYGTDLSVFRTRRGVGLRSFDGDPDDWNTIEFEKR